MSRTFYTLLAALLALAVASRAETGETGLKALKSVPKEATENLTKIFGYEGKPLPERWHIVAYDPKEENGVHEYVVAGGEVVASRNVSQFAETLKPEDVIGAQEIKIDTDKAVKLAQKFAQANGVTIAAYTYELKKDGDGAVPLWHLNCLDANGESLGKVVITATKGSVISHDGFAKKPGGETEKPKGAAHEERKPVEKKTDVRRAEPVRRPPPREEEKPGLFNKPLRIFGPKEPNR